MNDEISYTEENSITHQNNKKKEEEKKSMNMNFNHSQKFSNSFNKYV